MSGIKKWDSSKILKKLTKYINEKEEWMKKTPTLEILKFIETKDKTIALVTNLDALYFWNLNMGIVKIMDNDENGVNYISIACDYQFESYRLSCTKFLLGLEKGNDQGCVSLKDLIYSIAIAFLLEKENLIEIIKLVNQFYKLGIFYDSNSRSGRCTVNLIIRVIWDFYGIDYIPINEITLFKEYESMLKDLFSSDTSSLEPMFERLCEIHIERSRYDTSREYFEFPYNAYQIFPFEILLLLKIRKEKNLPAIGINHPIMQTKLCSIEPRPSYEKDEVLEKCADILRSEFYRL